MDKRISDLNSATSLQGTEVFAVVQGGETKKTTLNSMLYGVSGNNYGLFNQTGSSVPVVGSDYSGSLIAGGSGVLSVPANAFQKGDAYKAVFFGELTVDTNGNTLEIHIESDGVNLADTGVITMPKITSKNWQMEVHFSINEVGGAGTAEITTAGSIKFRTNSSNDVVTEIFSSTNNTSFDTTTLNTLVVKAIWANMSAADNIKTDIFTLTKLY